MVSLTSLAIVVPSLTVSPTLISATSRRLPAWGAVMLSSATFSWTAWSSFWQLSTVSWASATASRATVSSMR